ncbi:MAG: glycosyltransferase family 4 protein [Bacteroidia bacterium]|nr:glycosyltransferase family 4 protein [Bacteroidia bacterium]
MIVGHYIWSANIGGIEKITLDLATQQLRSGITPHILVGKNKGEWLNKLHSFKYSSCGLSNGYITSLKSMRIMRIFFAAVDVIHLHTFHPMVYLFAILSRKKIVYHIHGNWTSGRTEKWTDVIKRYVLRFFLTRFCSHLIFNSHYTQQRFSKQFKLSATLPQTVVHNGINAQELLVNNPQNTTFIVGTCGRLATVKRMDRVLIAFRLFARNRSNIQLNIVGDGPLLAELKLLAKKLGISSLVNFVGSVPNATNEIAQFTVTVLGSQGESFGLVALESLNQNKPTLVFNDGGGLTEIIQLVDAKNIAYDEDDMACLLGVYYIQWQNNNLHFKFDATLKQHFSITYFEQQISGIYSTL